MTPPATVGQALADARAAGLDRLDAQLLLAHGLGRDRSWVIAHDADALDAGVAARYQAAVARRAAGEPLAYLTGEREFRSLTLRVTPDVLVPRPDTETLVDWALECLSAPGEARPKVVDLGTGSGAIALAVAHACPQAEVTATDLSPAALDVARANAERLALVVHWRQGAWWQAVAGQRFDLALSNPPYIAGNDPHLAALTHEPRIALTPEGDGLQALRDIVATAPAHLRPGAWLLLEHGWGQADAVQALLRQAGFAEVSTRADLEGRPRCSGGRRS